MYTILIGQCGARRPQKAHWRTCSPNRKKFSRKSRVIYRARDGRNWQLDEEITLLLHGITAAGALGTESVSEMAIFHQPSSTKAGKTQERSQLGCRSGARNRKEWSACKRS